MVGRLFCRRRRAAITEKACPQDLVHGIPSNKAASAAPLGESESPTLSENFKGVLEK